MRRPKRGIRTVERKRAPEIESESMDAIRTTSSYNVKSMRCSELVSLKVNFFSRQDEPASWQYRSSAADVVTRSLVKIPVPVITQTFVSVLSSFVDAPNSTLTIIHR